MLENTKYSLENDELGTIIDDNVLTPLDLLALHGIDTEDMDDDITFSEFSEKYPNIWTYCLTDIIEALINNDELVLVRFFPEDQQESTYRVCEVSSESSPTIVIKGE